METDRETSKGDKGYYAEQKFNKLLGVYREQHFQLGIGEGEFVVPYIIRCLTIY
jgi:hypothetical protein